MTPTLLVFNNKDQIRSFTLKCSACSGLHVSLFPPSLTWDVCPVVLDVHLMQSRLGGRVLDRDRPVQVVCDQRLG